MALTGDLKVWWIPQVPMKAFEVHVDNIDEAILILETLASYDTFQYENKIKPDYSNVGGLVVYENDEWVDWLTDDGDGDIYSIINDKIESKM